MTHINTLSEASEAFSIFESTTGAYDLRIQNIPVWEMIRFSSFQQLCVKSGVVDKGHPKVPANLKMYFDYYSSIVKSYLSRIFLNLTDFKADALVLGHPRLLSNSEGYYEDPYSEAYLRGANVSYYYLERAYRGRHFKPRIPGKKVFIDDVRLNSSRSRVRLTPNEKRKLKELEEQLQVMTGCSITFVDFVSYALGRRALLLPFYNHLIRDIRPKFGVTVVGYLQPAFIEACRHANIPIVEIQHGVISKFHFGYNHNVSFPSTYYPDQLWLWGSYWMNAADYAPKIKLESVGYPLFDNYRRHDQIKKEEICLFISQGSVGKKIADRARALREAVPGLDICYRLHPSEFDGWRKNYSDLPKKNIRVLGAKDGSIYDWFKKSKYVIGGYSTALFEAVCMGCKVGVLNLPGIEYMEPLIEKKGATKIDTDWECFFGKEEEQSFKGNSIFKPFVSKHVRSLVSEMLENNK